MLNEGWFDGVRFGSPEALVSFVDVVYDPIVNALQETTAAAGRCSSSASASLLLSVLRLRPRAAEPRHARPAFERFSQFAPAALPMFLFGSAVTLITLSVSLSLTILVPLTLKGYVSATAIIPYVMGANIATWIDTLFASLLLDTPRAFTIVFTEMVVGARVSLIVLVFLYDALSAADPRR